MLYLKIKDKCIPVVDMMMDELQIINFDKAKLNMMMGARQFNSAYQELKTKIEEAEMRVANYRRMLAAHNETVGDNGDTYLRKVAGV